MDLVVLLNGKEIQFPLNTTIYELLDSIKCTNKRIAVEHNGKTIHKNEYNNIILQNNDLIEVVTAVGGG
ncbi:MAG: sulfur carrier protein ThiS [Bordetella sp.]|nr:MAG: sulfur carrier protein ThiS [Bordetella sp.]